MKEPHKGGKVLAGDISKEKEEKKEAVTLSKHVKVGGMVRPVNEKKSEEMLMNLISYSR